MRGSCGGQVGRAPARAWRGRRRRDRCCAADLGRAEHAPSARRTGGCPPGVAMKSASGDRALRACRRTGRPAAGSMSTTITRPTSSGRRAATIIASVPPIEWPTIAGRSSRAVGDVAGDLLGERRDHRAGAIAARRRAGEARDLDEMVAIARHRAAVAAPDLAARGQARDQDHVRARARPPRPRSASARSAARAAGAPAESAARGRREGAGGGSSSPLLAGQV